VDSHCTIFGNSAGRLQERAEKEKLLERGAGGGFIDF
jgi:hypothetical protein